MPIRIPAWLPSAAFFCAHALVLWLGAQHVTIVSICILVLAPCLAAWTCVLRNRAAGNQGWIMLAIALVLWAGGMAANIPAELVQGDRSGETFVSMLLFILYGVPIIFAAASPARDDWKVRVFDAVLALTLGALFFIHTFAVATGARSNPTDEASLRLMFDLQNLSIAAFALVRFRASRDAGDREVFGALTVFGFVYMAAAGYVNHEQSSDYGGAVDLVIDLPFLVLAYWIMRPLRMQPGPPAVSVRHASIVDAVSPLMLPAMLLAVAGAMLRSRPIAAIVGLAVATLVYGLRNVVAHIRNVEERLRLEHLAQIDALTGLPNRRSFDAALLDEWSRACRSAESMAIFMIDIDNFKRLNDTLGHAEGDRQLRIVAQALMDCAQRTGDFVARYGGEEFAVILPASDLAQASQLAEIMRARIYNLALHSPATGGPTTVSIGIGHFSGIQPGACEALLAAADEALYEAKHAGRNAVRVRTGP